MKNAEQLIHSFAGTDHNSGNFEGLTKREYFAGLAMQGLLTRVPNRHGGEVDLGQLEIERIVVESKLMADALLAELEKTE